jgi:hypothetical protein
VIDVYAGLRQALEGGVTDGVNAKTWTFSPSECFCDLDEVNPLCVLAGNHDDDFAVFTFEMEEAPMTDDPQDQFPDGEAPVTQEDAKLAVQAPNEPTGEPAEDALPQEGEE